MHIGFGTTRTKYHLSLFALLRRIMAKVKLAVTVVDSTSDHLETISVIFEGILHVNIWGPNSSPHPTL